MKLLQPPPAPRKTYFYRSTHSHQDRSTVPVPGVGKQRQIPNTHSSTLSPHTHIHISLHPNESPHSCYSREMLMESVNATSSLILATYRERLTAFQSGDATLRYTLVAIFAISLLSSFRYEAKRRSAQRTSEKMSAPVPSSPPPPLLQAFEDVTSEASISEPPTPMKITTDGAATPTSAVSPSNPGDAGVDDELLLAPTEPRPDESVIDAVHRALKSIINTTPDAAPAPLRCEPQRAPEGALPDKIAAGVKVLRATLEPRLRELSEAARTEAEAQLDDFTLARWVMAHGPDPSGAFLQAMEFRAANGVCALYAELHPRARKAAEPTARQAAVQAHHYGGLGGVARDGTPYMLERLGRADFSGYHRHGAPMEQLMREAYLAHLETLTRAVRVVSATTGKLAMGLVVIDTKGIGPSLLFNLALVKYGAKAGLNNFPEGTDRVFVVNAPALVARIFGLISPLLPEATRKKVKILSEASTRKVLKRFIDPAELPTFLGGEKPDSESGVPEAKPVPRQADLGALERVGTIS